MKILQYYTINYCDVLLQVSTHTDDSALTNCFLIHHAGNSQVLVCPTPIVCLPHQDCLSHSHERVKWISNACGTGSEWSKMENGNWAFSCGSFRRDFHAPCLEDASWGTTEFSADVIAAQAVSSLQIAEDAHVDTIVFDGMVG